MKNMSLNRKKYSLVGRISFLLNVNFASGLVKCNIDPERTNQRELEATDMAFISRLLENSNCRLSNSISSYRSSFLVVSLQFCTICAGNNGWSGIETNEKPRTRTHLRRSTRPESIRTCDIPTSSPWGPSATKWRRRAEVIWLFFAWVTLGTNGGTAIGTWNPIPVFAGLR